MFLSYLPSTTIINKTIPKNSFYEYCSSKQKKLFVEKINKIIWRNTLSINTINVRGNEVEEIIIIEIQLKEKININDLTNLINKEIPYHIVLYIVYEDKYYITTTIKHANRNDEDSAVIDWIFNSEWLNISNEKYKINLFNDLDSIYINFCIQLLGLNIKIESFEELINIAERISKLKFNIQKLESQINKCRQFNKKVELNSQLKVLKQELKSIIESIE